MTGQQPPGSQPRGIAAQASQGVPPGHELNRQEPAWDGKTLAELGRENKLLRDRLAAKVIWWPGRPLPEGAKPFRQVYEDDYAIEALESAREQRKRRDALRLLDAEDFRQPSADEMPGTLARSLLRPRPQVRYLVAGMLGARHNISVEGLFKAGKTSLLAALAGSLADGRPFLGFQPVTVPAGRVGIWNLEMDADDFEDYLKPEVASPDRVWIAHLRSRPLPILASRAAREMTVSWLRAGGYSVWVIDTWSRLCAWNAIDPIDNAGVATLTSAIDEIKGEAGVDVVVVSTHMPHSARTEVASERAYGAQTFSGWVDGMWRYIRHENGSRFLSADGRKIALSECQVLQDPSGRLVAQAGDRRSAGKVMLSYEVISFVRMNPGSTTNTVRNAVSGRAADVSKALEEARGQGLIVSVNGKNNSACWYPRQTQVSPEVSLGFSSKSQ